MMKFCAILIRLVCLAGSVAFGMTRDQEALLADVSDYHQDIASFEKAAAQAVRGGIPDCLVTLRRYYCLLQQGELAPMKVAMAHVEKVKAELLEQKFDPVDAGILEDTLAIGRKLVARAETDPTGVTEILTQMRGKSEANAHMRDLREIDAAIDQYAIEFNKRGGDVVPVEGWRL